MPDSSLPRRNWAAVRRPFANARWLCYPAIAPNTPVPPVPALRNSGALRAIKSPVLLRLPRNGRLRIPEPPPGMQGPTPGSAAGLRIALKRRTKGPRTRNRSTGFACSRYLQITTALDRAGIAERKKVHTKTKKAPDERLLCGVALWGLVVKLEGELDLA